MSSLLFSNNNLESFEVIIRDAYVIWF